MPIPIRCSRKAILLAFLFAFMRLLGGGPVRAARHERGAGRRQGGIHEATEGMYRAQGQ